MVDTAALFEQCAPHVSPPLMQALVRVESSWRPFAIGMDVGEGSVRQPATLSQAVAQAKALSLAGRGFSVGLAQIHVRNVTRQGMTWEQAFDPCVNLRTGQEILWSFYRRARSAGYTGEAALLAALRGYNAGAIDRLVGEDYAKRVLAFARWNTGAPLPKGRPAAAAVPIAAALGPPQRPASDPGIERSGPTGSSREAQEIFGKRSTVRGF